MGLLTDLIDGKETFRQVGHKPKGKWTTPTQQQAYKAPSHAARGDLSHLQEYGDPAAIESWQNIGDEVMKWALSDNSDAQKSAAQLLDTYGDQLKDYYSTTDVYAPTGERVTYDWLREKVGDPSNSDSVWSSIVSGASPVLNWLDSVGSGTMHGIAGLVQGDLGYAGSSVGQGLYKFLTPGIDMPGEAGDFTYRKLTEDDGTTRYATDYGGPVTNMRAALGADPNAGGLLAGAFDTAARIATDPLTYVGGAGIASKMGGGAARPVIKALRRAQLDDVADDILDRGYSRAMASLDDATRAEADAAIRRAAEEAVEGTTAYAKAFRGARTPMTADEMAVKLTSGAERAGRRGVRFAGRTVLPTPRALPRAAETLRTSKVVSPLRKAFSTSAGVVDEAGDLAGIYAKSHAALSRGRAARDSQVFERSILRAHKRLRKLPEYKGKQGALKLNQDLDELIAYKAAHNTPGTVPKGTKLPALSKEASKDVNKLADALTSPKRGGVRTLAANLEGLEELDALMKSRKLNPEQRRALGNVLGKEFQDNPLSGLLASGDDTVGISEKALKPLQGAGVAKKISSEFPTLRETDDIARQTVKQTNDQIRDEIIRIVGELPETSTIKRHGIFVDDVVTSAAARDIKYQRELARETLWKGIGDEGIVGAKGTNLEGLPLVQVGSDEDTLRAILRGLDDGDVYDAYFTVNGTAYATTKELKKALEGTVKILGEDEMIGRLQNLMQWGNSMFAGWATVPIHGGYLSFHGRNLMGNIFNAFLGGLQNPVQYARAAHVQHKMSKVWKHMSAETIDDFSDAVADMVSKGTLDAADGKILNMVFDDLGPGGRAFDLTLDEHMMGDAALQMDDDEWYSRAWRSKANLVGQPQSYLVKLGGQVGSTIENNARIALYLDQLKKGAGRQAARDHVYKFLFDYGDLTASEHWVRDNLSRFYTFTRKNMQLQLSALATTPGRTLAANRILQGAMGMAPGSGQDMTGLVVPDWQRDRLDGTVMPWTGGLLSVEDPFSTFYKNVSQIVGLMSIVPPVEDALKWAGAEEFAGGDRVDRISGGTELMSGFIPNTFTTLFEEANGIDTFTGRPLDSSSGWYGTYGRFFGSSFVPWMREIKRLADTPEQWQESAGLDTKDRFFLEFANRVLGTTSMLSTPGQQVDAVGQLQQQLREQGEGFDDVPTWDELAEEGYARHTDAMQKVMLYHHADPKVAARAWLSMSEADKAMYKEAGFDLSPFAEELYALEGITENSDLDEVERHNQQVFEITKRHLEQTRGRELTEDEIITLSIHVLGPTVTQLENAGIARPVDAERFKDGEDVEERNDFVEGMMFLNQLSNLSGITTDQLRIKRPLLAEIDRDFYDWLAAGHGTGDNFDSRQEFLEQFAWEEYFTNDQEARLRGIMPDTTPRATSMEDWEDVQRRTQDRVEELQFLQAAGYVIPYQRIMEELIFEEMTIGEQYATIGYREPKIPQRKSRGDFQTDIDAQLDLAAIFSAVGQPLTERQLDLLATLQSNPEGMDYMKYLN